MAGMADDEFEDAVLKLAEAVKSIEDLPLVDLAREIKSRAAKLKFQSPTAYRSAAPSLDAILNLTRVLMPVKQSVKRPLNVVLHTMKGLKDKMEERAAGVVFSKSTDLAPRG